MMLSLGVIAFILVVLTAIGGIWKTQAARKLHEYLVLLAIFSIVLHVTEKFIFSFDCLLLFLFLCMTALTGLKKFKAENKLRNHILFAAITLLILAWHVYPVFYAKIFAAWFSGTVVTGEGDVKLPTPSLEGDVSVEEALLQRRSIRDYLDKDVPLAHLSQLLWSGQGITSEWGGRTAPSAGATYPLELYAQVRRVEGIGPGIYHYNPTEHSLGLVKQGDFSDELMQAGLNQQWIKDASLNIIITAEFSRTTSKYGERGMQYVYLEAGHAAQNIYLQATALELGCVVIGAFNDEAVQTVISAAESHEPLYLIPVGHPVS